jgi:hypothetical protein
LTTGPCDAIVTISQHLVFVDVRYAASSPPRSVAHLVFYFKSLLHHRAHPLRFLLLSPFQQQILISNSRQVFIGQKKPTESNILGFFFHNV